ncbi:MAG: hypothetical protein QMB63_06560 [Clostridiaceae bacterium]
MAGAVVAAAVVAAAVVAGVVVAGAGLDQALNTKRLAMSNDTFFIFFSFYI